MNSSTTAQGDDVRGACALTDDAHLTEQITGAEQARYRLRAVWGGECRLHKSLLDQEDLGATRACDDQVFIANEWR
ncbi:hypothetical protein GCM10027563_45260 [Parasphingorhabdus pacifica]